MSGAIREYTHEELAGQPIGAWTGETCRLVVGAIRAELATEDLTQPHWWTLNHVARDPGKWTRPALTARLEKYDELGLGFDGVFDDLVARRWVTESAGAMTLTEAGEAGRVRAKERVSKVQAQVHEGIDAVDFVTTVNVLRRMVANLGGDGNLPG
ncbi:MarR family transcriptional regulator [Streptomyces sp. NPDC048295]|uniref:MarR family transcriptional regulator n=1 Tax=Streptomyces sp. NPDC048295 TaxID=3154617 RepID=UPI0034448A6E